MNGYSFNQLNWLCDLILLKNKKTISKAAWVKFYLQQQSNIQWFQNEFCIQI